MDVAGIGDAFIILTLKINDHSQCRSTDHLGKREVTTALSKKGKSIRNDDLMSTRPNEKWDATRAILL